MSQAGLYIYLFERREPGVARDVGEMGKNGPVFGPFEFVEVSNGRQVKFATDDVTIRQLTINQEGLLYYDGFYYDNFSVLFNKRSHGLIVGNSKFDPSKAVVASGP